MPVEKPPCHTMLTANRAQTPTNPIKKQSVAKTIFDRAHIFAENKQVGLSLILKLERFGIFWPYLAHLGTYLGEPNMVRWGVPMKILQNAV